MLRSQRIKKEINLLVIGYDMLKNRVAQNGTQLTEIAEDLERQAAYISQLTIAYENHGDKDS